MWVSPARFEFWYDRFSNSVRRNKAIGNNIDSMRVAVAKCLQQYASAQNGMYFGTNGPAIQTDKISVYFSPVANRG